MEDVSDEYPNHKEACRVHVLVMGFGTHRITLDPDVEGLYYTYHGPFEDRVYDLTVFLFCRKTFDLLVNDPEGAKFSVFYIMKSGVISGRESLTIYA